MTERFVVRGCPYLGTAYFATEDVLKDHCNLTEYELCADRDDCYLKQVAKNIIEDNIKSAKDMLQVEVAKYYFKSMNTEEIKR